MPDHLKSARFSCVYLTASFRALEIAPSLLDSAQIRIHLSTTLEDAKGRLQATRSQILLTDVTFEKGSWEDALRMAGRLPLRTVVVLAAHVADERLWLDALERGAYDLIFKPFHAEETRRILENAHFRATTGATSGSATGGGSCNFFLPPRGPSGAGMRLALEAPRCAA
jgi:DNA-binding NtrC family response regulator